MTNAERIRNMSDEELYEFLSMWEIGDIDYSVTFCDLCKNSGNTLGLDCDGCRKHWLESNADAYNGINSFPDFKKTAESADHLPEPTKKVTECDRNICYRQDYNGGCETCPCNTDVPETNVGKITTEQVVEALQTVKDFCRQTSVADCPKRCVLRPWCDFYADYGNRTEIPELWKIPKERTEEHEHD